MCPLLRSLLILPYMCQPTIRHIEVYIAVLYSGAIKALLRFKAALLYLRLWKAHSSFDLLWLY
jgi:hypothetical protein